MNNDILDLTYIVSYKEYIEIFKLSNIKLLPKNFTQFFTKLIYHNNSKKLSWLALSLEVFDKCVSLNRHVFLDIFLCLSLKTTHFGS
jgi:hypothetical protein